MRYLNLRPSQARLDPENPRLPDGTSSDREAINRLLDEGADALVNLARDMAATGQTNPAELPIVVKDGSKYLVLEGNRRFAALKLLADPSLANDEEYKKAFMRAAKLGTPPKTVYTLVAPDREQAEHWIVLRHTGENNGRGVRRWNASQTATQRRRANRTVDSGTLRSITIADELEEAYAADAELIKLVRHVRREKLTNIGRFFSKDVMTRLSFELEKDDKSNIRTQVLTVRHSADDLREFFVWAMAYIADNSVDAYKNAELREVALLKAKHLLPNPAIAADSPFRLAGSVASRDIDPKGSDEDNDDDIYDDERLGNGGQDDPQAAGGSGDGNDGGGAGPASGGAELEVRAPRGKNETRPERYLLQGLRMPNHPRRVQGLLKECRSLVIDDNPGIACTMIRVLVELSVSSPEALALSGKQESASLKEKIVAMLKYLNPDIEHPRRQDKDLAQAYLEASELGIQYMNGFVHNPAVVPDQHLARRFSSAFRPLLQRVDAAL